jgi:restriction endonuclease
MSHAQTFLDSFPAPDRVGLLPWGPALSQLRDLNGSDLDDLVRYWLTSLGLTAVRPLERRAQVATYQALLGERHVATPVHVRIYQRRNRLQVHHVDAFLGHLGRSGSATGILVTTGGFAREAVKLAAGVNSPRLRLISGGEWTAELASARAGVRRGCLAALLLDLRHLVYRPHRRKSRLEW